MQDSLVWPDGSSFQGSCHILTFTAVRHAVRFLLRLVRPANVSVEISCIFIASDMCIHYFLSWDKRWMLWLCIVTAECRDFALVPLNAVTLHCNRWMLWLCTVTAECCNFALWPLIAVTLHCDLLTCSPGTLSVWHTCYAWCCLSSARITYSILFFLSKHLQLCGKSQISLSMKRPQFLTELHGLLPSFEAYNRAAVRDSCCTSIQTCHSQMPCNFFS